MLYCQGIWVAKRMSKEPEMMTSGRHQEETFPSMDLPQAFLPWQSEVSLRAHCKQDTGQGLLDKGWARLGGNGSSEPQAADGLGARENCQVPQSLPAPRNAPVTMT